jgi:hypothetical protein
MRKTHSKNRATGVQSLEVGLVSVQRLSEATGISQFQVNDYIRRGLLKVANREGRTRLLREPPAHSIINAIREYMNDHGNLNKCLSHLMNLFPDYYRES